jgi:hypothetical protein
LESAVDLPEPAVAGQEAEDVPVGEGVPAVEESAGVREVEPAGESIEGGSASEENVDSQTAEVDTATRAVEPASEAVNEAAPLSDTAVTADGETAPGPSTTAAESGAASATSLEEAAVPVESTSVEERKQERVENPLFTLEIVGNRYNTSNFWYVAASAAPGQRSKFRILTLPGPGDGEHSGLSTGLQVRSKEISTSMCTTTSKAM